eukprot:12400742-Karenia_brevis.AAC.1
MVPVSGGRHSSPKCPCLSAVCCHFYWPPAAVSPPLQTPCCSQRLAKACVLGNLCCLHVASLDNGAHG